MQKGAVLLVAKGVNHIDLAGAQLLQAEVKRLERQGRAVLISSLKGYVRDELEAMGQLQTIGAGHFKETTGEALRTLLSGVDTDICQTCSKRVFGECSKLPGA